jgi:hypothetical protein
MVVCTKCGHRNDDGVEFCANPKGCGAFLAYVGKKAEALSGGVTLAVVPAVVSVKPGEEATTEVRIRNKSNVVDQYDIQVVGEPSRWTIAEPTTLSLFPDAEGVAKVRFRPVRSPQVQAGRKPFSIAVQSKASANISADQDGILEVAPFREATLGIVPRTARGGASASYRLTVDNHGNVPLQLTLEGIDPDDLMTFRFDPPALLVAPGQSAYSQLLVQPRATFYDGPPQPHAFKVQLAGDSLTPVTTDVTLLQEPVARPLKKKFPLIPVLLAVLLIGLIGGALIERDPLMQLVGGKSAATAAPNTANQVAPSTNSATPSPTPTPVVLATIPNVTCMNPAVAQQAIQNAGFKFVGSFVANSFYANGTVFKTEPGPGEAPRGSEVTAFVSTGPPPNSIVGRSLCLSVIKVLPSNIFKYIPPTASP